MDAVTPRKTISGTSNPSPQVEISRPKKLWPRRAKPSHATPCHARAPSNGLTEMFLLLLPLLQVNHKGAPTTSTLLVSTLSIHPRLQNVSASFQIQNRNGSFRSFQRNGLHVLYIPPRSQNDDKKLKSIEFVAIIHPRIVVKFEQDSQFTLRV